MLDLLIHCDELSTFTYEDLRQKGHTQYEIAAAIQDGNLVVVGTVRTGMPGRPQYKFQLTAKGVRAVKKHKKEREMAAILEAKRKLEEDAQRL